MVRDEEQTKSLWVRIKLTAGTGDITAYYRSLDQENKGEAIFTTLMGDFNHLNTC